MGRQGGCQTSYDIICLSSAAETHSDTICIIPHSVELVTVGALTAVLPAPLLRAVSPVDLYRVVEHSPRARI